MPEVAAVEANFVATVYTYNSTGSVTSVKVSRYAAGSNLDAEPMPAPLEVLRETRYGYGTGGLMTSMTDPNGNITYYGYNSYGYMTKVDSPPGTEEMSRRVTTLSRNADGSVASQTDPNGNKTTYGYDGLGRHVKTSYGMQDGAADFSETGTYGPNGNVLAMIDREGKTEYAYDENDRPTSESRTQNGVTKTASYAY